MNKEIHPEYLACPIRNVIDKLLLSLFLTLLPFLTAQSQSKLTMNQLEVVSNCSDDPSRLDEGLAMADSLLALPGISRDPLYAQLLYLKSHVFMTGGDFARCKAVLTDMLRQLDRGGYAKQLLTDPNDLSICLPHDLGLVCRREAKNDSALFYYERALDVARQHDDHEWQAVLCTNIGVLHYNLGHITEAEQLLDRGYELIRGIDDPYSEMSLLQVRAGVKLRLDKIDEARQSIEPAYQLALLSEMPDWQLRCLTSMLSIYDRLGQTDSTAVTLERADALLPQVPPTSVSATGYLSARGTYFMDHSQWQKAADDFLAALSTNAPGVQTQDFFNNLARCFAALHQWERAYQYKDSADVYGARETEAQFASRLADFNVRYETMEKDLQISRLQAQRTRIIVIAVATVVIVALLLLLLWLFQRQRRFRQASRLRISTLEEERARIARELHDGLCNDMLAVEMQCAAGDKPELVSQRLSQLRQQARALSHQLMPPAFDHLSLPQLLSLYAQQLQADTALSVVFTDQTSNTHVYTQQSALELYRIAQEHTANIVKGHTATTVAMTLTDDALIIADDGQPTGNASPDGIGQRTIADRAVNIGATVTSTNDGRQNILRVQMP